jgi:uncharacterized protein YjdB
MIYKKCVMTIEKNKATLDEDIYLYRLDKNIELYFTIVNNKYRFNKSDMNNIIMMTNAAFFQVRLYKNAEIKYTFAIQPTDGGQAILTITDDLIDDPIEVGDYDFQISLLDEEKTSMISMPIVSKQLHVCEPLVSDDATMGKAILGLSKLATGEIKNAFDSEGNYIREIHKDGDILSASIINKFEDALDSNTKAIKAGTGKAYDDTAIKTDINTIKTDLGTETLTTTAKDVKGAVNEVAAQYKDIANKIENGNIGNNIEPQLMDMPRIYFSEGTLPTSKTATMMKFDYYSKTTEYHGWVEIKCQGNSSMSYPKKNFTIKPYQNKAKTKKLKIDFKGWGKQNKFVLKANWIDITHARNVVSARLWGDIVKTRPDYATALPELLRTSPNQGAVDGFPVLVYSNGVYQGRYTLNIPKDKWMSNMDDTLDTHCILCGENYVSGCFRALPQINGTDWTDELHDVVPATIKTSWTNAIKFVMNSTDAEFKANLGNYFDVNSLIDYLLYGIVSTGLDAFGKNQIYFTYDGIKWIASMYDMDSTWGLYWNGSKILPTDYRRNQYEDYANNTSNLLYNRLEQLYKAQLKTRYTELRKDVLSASHIIQKFEEFNDVCPKDIVQEDYASTTGAGKFTGMPSLTTNNIQQLRNNIVGRLAYVDEYINALKETVACTNITLNNDALTFTTDAAQTLTATVTPTDTTDKVVWSVSPSGICSVNNGVVTPISNGSCKITATCGTHSATCNVTVNLPVEAVTALSLDKDNITLGDTTINVDTTTNLFAHPTNVTTTANGNIQGDILLEKGVYTIKNINGGTLTWLGVKINNVAYESKDNTNDMTFTLKNEMTVIIHGFPNNVATNTIDKIGVYQQYALTDNVIAFTEGGDGYIDDSTREIVASTNDKYSQPLTVDSNKRYVIIASKNGQMNILKDNKVYLVRGTFIFTGVPTIQISIKNSEMSLSDVKVIEIVDSYKETVLSSKITATLTPANATNKNVTWSADNENVQLLSNGLNCTVKAKAVGNSIVTCTSQDTTNGTISDTCNVTVSGIS